MSTLSRSNSKDVEKAMLQKELMLYRSLLSKHDKLLQASKKEAIKRYNSKAKYQTLNRNHSSMYVTYNTHLRTKPLQTNNISVLTEKKAECDKFKSQFYSSIYKKMPNAGKLLPTKTNNSHHFFSNTQTETKFLLSKTRTLEPKTAVNLPQTSQSSLNPINKPNSEKLRNDIKALTLLLEQHEKKKASCAQTLPVSVKSPSAGISSLCPVKNSSCEDNHAGQPLCIKSEPIKALVEVSSKTGNEVKKEGTKIASKKQPKVYSLSASTGFSKTIKPQLDTSKNVKSATEIEINLPSERVNNKRSEENELRGKLTLSLMKRVAESNHASLTKIEETLKKLQSTSASSCSSTLSVSSTKKPSCLSKVKKTPIKLLASKYKVVNKKSPCFRAVKYKISPKASQKIFSTPTNPCSPPKTNKKTVIKTPILEKDLFNSKYKVVNKKSTSIGTTKCKFSPKLSHRIIGSSICSPKLCNYLKQAKNKSSKSPIIKIKLLNSKFKIVNKSKTPVMGVMNKAYHQGFVTNSNKKIQFLKRKNQSKNFIKPVQVVPENSLKYKQFKFVKHNNSNCNNSTNQTKQNSKALLNSKYKFIRKNNFSNKSPKVRSNSCELNVSDMDIDLLLEIAEEKKRSENKASNKKFLLKRVFKNKRTIVNKNIDSAQAKVAKMIKTKYSTFQRKRVWLKNFPSKSFNSFQHYTGHLHHGLFNRRSALSFYYQNNTRNVMYRPCFSHRSYRNKFSMRSNNGYHASSYKTSSKIVSQQRFTPKGSPFCLKSKTPLSKVVASRVLNRSINRALSASAKKNLPKNKIYCMFYNRFGRCNKGLKCSYIHDPRRIAVCTRYLRGTCKTKNCPFSHEKNPGKMAICTYFLLDSCTKINCPYRHEKLSPDTKLCKEFVQGYCPEGKDCKNAHVLICPQYVQGICNKGKDCVFPHPPPKEKKNSFSLKAAEKEKTNMQERDILVEKVSRYFESLSKKTEQGIARNSVVPKRAKLDEQPSFIALSFNDGD